MSVRKELLERELSRLGFRKAEAARKTASPDASSLQQEGQSSHPQAEDDSQHGD